jgi:imidazolonepropionase-like amidohydrolase
MKRPSGQRWSAWVATLLTASCVRTATPISDQVIVDHVTVLDGRGGPALTDARVLVRGGRIVQVKPASGVAPTGTVLDGTGRYLVPGYIDMHAHLLFPRCSRGASPTFDRPLSERALGALLDFGITTVRSPATPTLAGLKLRDDLNAGIVRGPRAFAAAELINDSELSEADFRRVVRDAVRSRPDAIKAYSNLRPSQVAIVVDEAHRHGVPVIGHLQRTTWLEGVALGVDHLAHAVDWSPMSLPEAKRTAYLDARRSRRGFQARIDWLEAFDSSGGAHAELLAALVRKRVSVDVTLVAYEGKFSSPDDDRFRRNPWMADFPELREDWVTCDDATREWTADDFKRWRSARRTLHQWVKTMSEAGVLLVSGTDLTNEWVTPGDGLHQEFELLAEAGLSADQILRMTGSNAGEALGRDDVGIIAEGSQADLVLLSADPRVSISNTRAIVWVMKGGAIVSHGPLIVSP